MFWNNVKVALRNLQKNKFFATINIAGLAIGLTVFVFGNLLVRYETTHDAFFEKAARTYTIGSIAAPALNVGIDKFNSVHSALGPLIKTELPDVEYVARTLIWEYLVTMGADSYYQGIRFADPELLRIFDLDYLHGDETALDDPSGVLITESIAVKYFGRTDVLGEAITLDNEYDYRITAVVRDLPLNSHFNSLVIIETDFEMFIPLKALARMRDFDEAGEWDNLSLGNMTYVTLKEGFDLTWLQAQLDGMYGRYVPENIHEVISAFWAVPLVDANTSIWVSLGMPVIAVVKILSFLVLIVACVNYTNLATAQSLGRSREVGMRKTMGAEQGQLITQFLVESLVIAAIAMVIAVAALEVLIPIFNNLASKALTLDYLGSLPLLVLTVILVGICAGLYPAWLITRASPIDALRDVARKGKKGSTVRSVMIGAQFAISAFMLAIVSVVYMQNEKVKNASYEFPRSEVYVLQRLDVDEIRGRLDTLRHELEALPDVKGVAYSWQVPYQQTNSTLNASRVQGDVAGKFSIQILRMAPEFLDVYDIPLLAGRNIGRDMANDSRSEDRSVINVLVNEMALERLGISSPAEAINQRFFDVDDDGGLEEFVIVGVVPTQNITGLFNSLKPWVYYQDNRNIQVASVRITSDNMMRTIGQVEETWKRVIPEYPIQGRFLDDVFNDVYNILKLMNGALAGFAFIALALALIGLFGLAAFMAAQRTKEIGIRKVLGADSLQIARLLVWQFSKPVLLALCIALPAAFLASSNYLNFFADRIDTAIPILLVSGVVAVILAWVTVAGHAIRIARSNPVLALRYE
ncbi:MAG: ABC transporter permease [Gammaproteobacteria bacterium]|nr:ABC transporter permease [Gammaproteobacteria bacterium]MDH5310254.1 ABC transporter permease [Gammaproteobacteria bacterium]